MYKISTICLLIFSPFWVDGQIGQIKLPADSTAEPLSISATGYYYFFSGTENNTLTLIGYLDYKSLHLEPRYNYEAQNSGSVFAGWKFSTEGKINFMATPMVGLVFGSLQGLAPALELEFSYHTLDLYTENEYVIDFAGSQNNYFYTWTELGFSPIENFRTGISAQRTRLYQTGLSIQRGIFAEYSFWKLTAGLHYFNPFTSEYFFIASLNIEL